MQEEVAKYTKKIYQAMREPGHSFWEKTREIAIVILIIVFAVALSIWLHSWSDHRHEQKETQEFLKGLKNDLLKDIDEIEGNMHDIARVDSDFKYIMALNNQKRIDTASEETIMHRLFFAPSLNDGESTVNNFQTQVLGVELDKSDKQSRDLAKTYKIRALLQITSLNLDGNLDSYSDAHNQARNIISLIDRAAKD